MPSASADNGCQPEPERTDRLPEAIQCTASVGAAPVGNGRRTAANSASLSARVAWASQPCQAAHPGQRIPGGAAAASPGAGGTG